LGSLVDSVYGERRNHEEWYQGLGLAFWEVLILNLLKEKYCLFLFGINLHKVDQKRNFIQNFFEIRLRDKKFFSLIFSTNLQLSFSQNQKVFSKRFHGSNEKHLIRASQGARLTCLCRILELICPNSWQI